MDEDGDHLDSRKTGAISLTPVIYQGNLNESTDGTVLLRSSDLPCNNSCARVFISADESTQ
jgi:hypothetical protein